MVCLTPSLVLWPIRLLFLLGPERSYASHARWVLGMMMVPLALVAWGGLTGIPCAVTAFNSGRGSAGRWAEGRELVQALAVRRE